MARTCGNCNYSNSNTSHYCVKCGEPLEKTWIWASKPDKRYEVIAKTELESLRNERNRLRKQIDDSWGIKIERWIKDNKNTIGWTIASIFALFFVGWIFSKCDFIFEPSETIQILKDETSGKYGIFNNESNILVVPCEYDSISHRKGNDYQGDWNFFFIYKNGKLGVADSLGRITISCELDSARGLYNGIDILYKDGKQGLMNSYGQQILPCEYQYVLWETMFHYSSFEHPGAYVGNILPVKVNENGGWDLYNRNGKIIRGQHYKFAIQTGDPSLIKVVEDGRDYKYLYGIVDENGLVVIPCKYYSISVFGNERAWAKESYSDSWSLIDTKGDRIKTLPEGLTPSVFHDGMAAVKKNGKIGYCDISGEIVIPMNYEQIRNNDGSYTSNDFYYGKARVSYNGVAGYIDKNGKFTAEISENK